MNHGKIIIARADEILGIVATQNVAAVLSIEHPGATLGRGGSPRMADHGHAVAQKVLSFWDTEQTAVHGPDIALVDEGIHFILDHLSRGDVLVNCHAGKSRSVAIVLGALAQLHPDATEEALISMLLAIRPVAAPNILVVEMADALAGRDGKLLQAVKNHPILSLQRAQAEESRLRAALKHPEVAEKLFPEKFPKP